VNVELIAAGPGDRAFIQDMGRLYVYEIARAFGPDPEWAISADWLYDAEDLGDYWQDGNHAFLIHADGRVAGFCLIDRHEIAPGIDWNMGQFFVLGPYAGHGVGRQAATQAFDRFPGLWQVTQIFGNDPAIAFWRRVIGDYTGGRFDERTLPDLRRGDEARNVMTFQSPPAP
jgi:predicted acetyltransferase